MGGVITEATGRQLYFNSLWKACWELPTSGEEEKYTTLFLNLIKQCATANKTQYLLKKNACARTDVETWFDTVIYAYNTHWKTLI